MDEVKLDKALENLTIAVKQREKQGSSVVTNAAVSKCFEVALEYAWKALKRRIEEEGLEAVSPKDCIKVGATINIISQPEQWIKFINNRNLSVHDYIGIDDGEYFSLIKEFLTDANELKSKL